MGIFEDVGKMAGQAMAKERDAQERHMLHEFTEKAPDCERCLFPEKFIVHIPNYDYDELIEL